jgi:hypothetical protein
VAYVSFYDSEQKKGAFPVMLVNTLSFKDHLDLTNRLEIALEYLKHGGFYGIITDLANAYNTNRQRVYDILDRVLSAFHPKPPGLHPIQRKPERNGLLSWRLRLLVSELEFRS